MEPKPVWTVREVAQWCGVSVRTVLNWIERGDLRSFKLPGRGDNRIRMEDLVDFLGRHQMPLPGAGRATAPKVLIVDDSPADVKLASKALQLMDCDLEVARDGFSAGAALGSFQPDLVTLDLRMPGLSGFEVIKLMRGTPAYKGIKILVVSSMPTEELERAREAGADDVLQKPVDYKTLQEKVTTLLGTALSGKANRQNLERMG